MKRTTEITDTEILETFFRKNTALNIYAIGDLDEFFLAYTNFYALIADAQIRQVVYIYRGSEPAVLQGICEEDEKEIMKDLVSEIIPVLPEKFYSHLTPGIEDVFKEKYSLKSYGKYFKMSLLKNNFKFIPAEETEIIKRITPDEFESLNEFYDRAYTENRKDERKYEKGK